jgi:hypothetical protein
MNFVKMLLKFLKLLMLCGLGAVFMGGAGLADAAVAAPIIIQGGNPHTDGMARIGLAYAAAIGGAVLGVLGVVAWAAYHWLKKPTTKFEN